ncbi:phage tail tape measure protein [Bifidobacterium longum]|uniref:Phage tail tape measure protein, TP901 family n=1 Tax=Bifidobacterium longum subsp. suis TaxID=1695 RepID=A0A087BHI8_BIFLN|nr:phage tail tape measure protein [Bifidobacterium longum]KFI70488.1 phage tail tape measure protein, TP901 family [Bifidobacterium longum subsp. suis]MBH0364332.1 phage tail tape measure protein [Bifidobacterium longum]MBM5830530.1 phage tail tape measure protein [Bifidobacterium longum subsp. suillum]QSG86898.1 phage tail tape measure protein [Bifidobacterium longum subsp. suillum]QXT31351.1 phage tail tape measure protein [Bifidobacterium longum subsp. suillum]
MAENKNIVIRLMADTASYEAAMTRAGSTAKTVASGMENTGRKSALIASGMTTAGLAVAAFGVAAVKMAADFDQQMSTVQANTGATSAQMGQLRAAAIEAGASTVYSATESADAINELGKAGLSTSDILSGGLSGALNLAASDGMAVGDAAELMATTLKQFNLTGAESTQVADALAAGAGKAVGSANDLGLALNQAGLVANSMGVSMQETTGTLAAFANAGMIGSDAGTSLKTMLQRLASPTDKAQSLMDELGINVYDANGKFIGLAGAAGQLQNGLSGLSQQERNAALNTIFGADAVRAANVLYEEGAEGIDGWTKAVSQSGYAADLAAKKNDNLKGDLENLGGSMESLMISIGEGAQGPLRKMVQGLDTLVDAFAGLPSGVQQTLVVMASLAGVFGAVHKAAGNLNGSTSIMANNIGLAIDPIQRVKAALASAQTAFQMFRASSMSASEQMETFGTSASKAELKTAGFKAVGSSVIDLLGGPWGVAITAATTVLGAFISEQQKAQERSTQLSNALQEGTSAAQHYEKALSDSSGARVTDNWLGRLITGYDNVWQAIDKVGIKHSTYIKAIQGEKTAVNEVYKGLDAYRAQLAKQGGLFTGNEYNVVANSLTELQKGYKESQISAANLAQAEKESTQASIDKTGALLSGADAASQSAGNAQEAASADDILSEAFGATTDAVSDTASALSEVIDAMQTYYGFAISSSDAQVDLANKISSANDTISQNVKTLDLNTEAGRENQSALNDIADAALKCAKAQAQNGDSLNDIYPNIDKAHDAFTQLMQSLGKTPEEAEAAAQAYGLTRDAVDELVNSLQNTPDSKTIEVTVTGDAVAKFEQVKLAAKETPDGKHVTISGDNTDLMKKIAQAANAKIDDKTGTLTLDSDQYMIALAIANGAKIDDKTGYLKGDNSDAMNKFLQTQGWKLNDKGFIVNADGSPAMSVLTNLSNYQIADKYFQIHGTYVDESGGTYSSSGYRPANATGNIPTGATGGLYDGDRFRYANGGYAFNGYVDPKWAPGTATSDSVYLDNGRIARGEYVENALATSYYGVDFMDALNRRAIPREVFATANQMTGNQVSVQVDTASVVAAITSLHNDLGAIISAASNDSTVSDRDLGRLIRKYARV